MIPFGAGGVERRAKRSDWVAVLVVVLVVSVAACYDLGETTASFCL
jgi:hypothetical protein